MHLGLYSICAIRPRIETYTFTRDKLYPYDYDYDTSTD